MAKCGVKAIMYAGEGESTLHEDLADMIIFTKQMGIDVALTTNGVLCNQEFLELTLPSLSWIKFSVDALHPSTYSKLHGAKEGDILVLFKNIMNAVRIRNKCNYECTIGTQSILFNENWEEMYELVPYLKSLGVDYFVLKPFSNHSKRKGKKINPPEYSPDGLEDFESDKFKVIERYNAFNYLDKKKSYDKCYAQDFVAYIDTSGGVHSCINYIDDKDYCYGNIYNDTFENIWKNKKEINPDLTKCRSVCRLDSCNRYLNQIKNPPPHINFI